MPETRVVGELSYDPRKIIGEGYFASVFLGLYRDSLPVAVKRKQKQPYRYGSDDHDQQLQLLQVTQHPKILRCIGFEENDDFTYVINNITISYLSLI